MVLLHGFPDSGRMWRHQVAPLADAGFKVIVPDQRGYGASDKPEGVDAYNILHLVTDVGAVLADAGVERAHVVGHDWGAAVAWVLGAVAPQNVDHLVALSVGNPSGGNFRGSDFEQTEKSWYMLLFQFEGIAERWLSENDWVNMRRWAHHPDRRRGGEGARVDGRAHAGPQLVPGQHPRLELRRAGPRTPAGPGRHHGHLEQWRPVPHRGPDDPIGGVGGGEVALRAAGRAGPLDGARGSRPAQPAPARLPPRITLPPVGYPPRCPAHRGPRR